MIETAPVKLAQGHITGRIKWIRVGEITKLLPCLLGCCKAHSILGDLHKTVSIPLQISLRIDQVSSKLIGCPVVPKIAVLAQVFHVILAALGPIIIIGFVGFEYSCRAVFVMNDLVPPEFLPEDLPVNGRARLSIFGDLVVRVFFYLTLKFLAVLSFLD